jgi:hypothetical protein
LIVIIVADEKDRRDARYRAVNQEELRRLRANYQYQDGAAPLGASFPPITPFPDAFQPHRD